MQFLGKGIELSQISVVDPAVEAIPVAPAPDGVPPINLNLHVFQRQFALLIEAPLSAAEVLFDINWRDS